MIRSFRSTHQNNKILMVAIIYRSCHAAPPKSPRPAWRSRHSAPAQRISRRRFIFRSWRSSRASIPPRSSARVDSNTHPNTLSCRSRCTPSVFRTPAEASRAADAAVARLNRSLRPLIDATNPKDGVFSRGGFTQPFYRRTRHGQTVCEGTFQKVSNITVKSSRIDSFSRDYVKLQRAVLTGTLKQPVDPGDQSTTHATLSAPTPQLYFETRERLEQQALANAIDNARTKLAATAKAGCRTAQPQLLKFENRIGSMDGPSRMPEPSDSARAIAAPLPSTRSG